MGDGVEGRAKTILIIDESSEFRAAISAYLRLEGFRVREAASAEEALEALRDAPGEVDLILSDLMLPRMSAFDFRAALSTTPELRDLPLVLMSSSATVRFAAGTLRAAGYLRKPFEMFELQEILQQALP